MKFLIIDIALLLLVTVSASAQTGTTSVRGTVLDKTGAAIAGAKVSLTNTGQLWRRETETRANIDF